MPPPRPRSIGCSAGANPSRPNPNTPMSERQQMALLIQMTATSDNARSAQKCKELKREEDVDENHTLDKTDNKEKIDESLNELKKDGNNDHPTGSDSTGSNTNKRNFSDIDEEESEEMDEVKKKKRKDADSSNRDSKQNNALRLPVRPDKASKQANNSKTTLPGQKSSLLSEKEELQKGKSIDSEVDDDDSKSDPLSNGGLKVPPLKIVIPQQNCSIDSDGSGTRTGKLNASRNAALPYVVSSNNEERDISAAHTSPRDSPVKINHSCSASEEKNCKHLNEEKNLRVLRSAHRVGTATERNSNNSSPQIPSNSPSPASVNTNDIPDSKAPYANSPPHQNAFSDQDNILNLPSPSASSTSSSKEVFNNNELHPRKRKIRTKNEEVAKGSGTSGNNDVLVCSESHPHDLPFTNCFQMYMNIRKQVERKWKNVQPIKPRPPQGFNEYLITTKKYILHQKHFENSLKVPDFVSPKMKEIYVIQQKDRFELYQRQTVEREKLCLNVEQEIIRIHSKAARCMSCQSLPYSACTYIKDEEVYNIQSTEQEDKDKNARCRFNGRLLLSWLQDVDDKWEKMKESMVLRHHNEAESLHAVQTMDWESALKKYELYGLDAQSSVDKDCVPIISVLDDFDLLPA